MKKIFILIILLSYTLISKAQWSFSSGLGILTAPTQKKYVNLIDPTISNPQDSFIASYDINAFGVNAFFYPKYHFGHEKQSQSKRKSKRNTSYDKPYDFSLGSPVIAGISFGGYSNVFMYSVAVMGDINFGSKILDSERKIGGFAGVGLGISNTNQKQINNPDIVPGAKYNSKYKTISNDGLFIPKALGFGPMVHAGFLANLSSRSNSSNLGVDFAYQAAINKTGLNYFQIRLQIPLGNMYNNAW